MSEARMARTLPIALLVAAGVAALTVVISSPALAQRSYQKAPQMSQPLFSWLNAHKAGLRKAVGGRSDPTKVVTQWHSLVTYMVAMNAPPNLIREARQLQPTRPLNLLPRDAKELKTLSKRFQTVTTRKQATAIVDQAISKGLLSKGVGTTLLSSLPEQIVGGGIQNRAALGSWHACLFCAALGFEGGGPLGALGACVVCYFIP